MRILEAAEAEAAAAPNAPVIVAVFLPGGCDLLDTIVPLNQFGALRRPAAGPQGRPGRCRSASTGLGLNPQLGARA